MASTYLTRTNSTGGNRQVFTFSAWIKRSGLGGMKIFDAGTSTSTDSGRFYIGFFGVDTFAVVGGATTYRVTNQLFRDTSAWYHFVVGVDTTQATADDRIKVYVNGSQVTSFSTNNAIALNQNTPCNENAKNHDIGRNQPNNSEYFDGYMADINFIDGTQYAASDFGQTDSTGIWKPKGFSGTYGTNGAYLKMSNSGDLGADSSGNGNNFTKSGNGRQRTDTPSNVFATINSLANYYNPSTLSQGNLRVDFDSGVSTVYNISTLGVTTGKWYCEIDAVTIPGYAKIGIASRPCIAGGNSDNLTVNQYNYGYSASNGNVDSDATAGGPGGTYIGYGATWTSGDIIGIGLDLDNNRLYFSKNGTWQNSADPAAGTGGVVIADPTSTIDGVYYFAVGDNRNDFATRMDCNFGNPITTISSGNTDDNGYGNFEYAPPTGYLALCTKNLATEAAPTIDDGSAYFQTKTYTGNGVETAITNDGNSNLQPDLIWFKARSAAYYHGLFDSIRGTELRLSSNVTDAESTKSSALTSFDSDGFTVGADVSNTTNANGQTFVAWQWKANGGTTSSNTDGSITSTVQANTTAGFSIVTYTGNGTNGSSIGHGLGQAPAFIIVKRRDGTSQWVVENVNSLGMYLNLSDSATTSSNVMDFSSSSTITFDTSNDINRRVNFNGETYVAYCFADIEGYSKFGSYTGNGSADGPFVYTGFRPAWIMIKGTSSLGADQAYSTWSIWDINRSTYNVTTLDQQLTANTSYAEGTRGNGGSGSGIVSFDILSNGFKIRNGSYEYNQGGYIYMAFAEHPFVTSGGLPVTAR